MPIAPDYLEEIRKRGKKTRAYSKFQLLGLEIAGLLEDEEHKALYIKLAKERDGRMLWRIAREVSEKKNVKNKGAYFMKLLASEG